jgi:hypothetical protein
MYVNKDDDKEVIYEAYQKVLNNLRVQRHKNKQHVVHKREIIKEKNKKYNALNWKYFRMKQVLFGLDLEIKKLKNVELKKKVIHRKKGYEDAMKKINKIAFDTESPYRFIAMCNLLCESLNISIDELSFVLWANQYDFFTKKEFDRDLGKTSVSYYHCLSKLQKKGKLNKILKVANISTYSLTILGKKDADRMNKFIKNIK